MPENENINNFSAADIERYHKGQMSRQEMHALEKAALDDPFLADAIEGYKQEGLNAGADLTLLREKLKQRIGGSRLVELKSRRSFVGWKAAAAIIIIIGAGILVYQFAINKGTDKVVQVQEQKEAQTVTAKPDVDSIKENTATNNTSDVVIRDESAKGQKTEDKAVQKSKQTETSGYKADTVNTFATVAAPGSISENKDSLATEPARDVARSENSNIPQLQKAKKDDGEAEGIIALDKPSAKMRQSQSQPANVFRGQVLDANYNALPFANITSINDKIGTYADAKGNFILTSATDSVLNVLIKSVGYENGLALLRNDLPKNQVVLQEDTKNLNEIVINNKKSNSNRRKKSDIKIEEPEPEDGWENYDTYLLNNLNLPGDIQIKSQANPEVQISFNVDKNGDPVNIKVEKSLCKECDIEAIRLLKNGPKWTAKGRKSRATVTVPF